jgi:hypothetical protein
VILHHTSRQTGLQRRGDDHVRARMHSFNDIREELMSFVSAIVCLSCLPAVLRHDLQWQPVRERQPESNVIGHTLARFK